MLTTSGSRRLAAGAIALFAACALSACGGGGKDGPGTTAPPPTGSAPPPSASGDSFFAIVYAKVIQMLDTEEPAALDQVTETKPETTEPEPVPAG